MKELVYVAYNLAIIRSIISNRAVTDIIIVIALLESIMDSDHSDFYLPVDQCDLQLMYTFIVT